MKKLVRSVMLWVLTVVAIFFLSTCQLQQLLAASREGFKEDNSLYYTLFVDKEIKAVPRIADNYGFTFSGMDGPKPETSNVVFQGKHNISKRENYLTSIGYHRSDVGHRKKMKASIGVGVRAHPRAMKFAFL